MKRGSRFEEEEEEQEAVMQNNRFDNKGGGDQNIAQGNGAVAKQVNVTQHITGNGNIVSGTGDVKVRR